MAEAFPQGEQPSPAERQAPPQISDELCRVFLDGYHQCPGDAPDGSSCCTRTGLAAVYPLIQAEVRRRLVEGAMTHRDVAEQIGRYFRAVHGPDYVYRAPESYPNVLERWMIAVALDHPEFAETTMSQIEALAGERR